MTEEKKIKVRQKTMGSYGEALTLSKTFLSQNRDENHNSFTDAFIHGRVGQLTDPTKKMSRSRSEIPDIRDRCLTRSIHLRIKTTQSESCNNAKKKINNT